MSNSSSIYVRPARASDFDMCVQLDRISTTDHVWQMVFDDSEDTLAASFRPLQLPRSMNFPYPRSGEGLLQTWRVSACSFVAVWDRQVVGYGCARDEPTQSLCWITDIIVDRPLRRQGIGSKLLQAVRRWALDNNLRCIITEAQTKNYPAIRFYKKQGLAFCGYNELYYPNQDIAVFFGEVLR
jgi:ribosomal protein S18 acetylase RimI-like enzyme